MVLVAFGDPNDPTGQRVLPAKWSCVEHGPACSVFPAQTGRTVECEWCPWDHSHRIGQCYCPHHTRSLLHPYGQVADEATQSGRRDVS